MTIQRPGDLPQVADEQRHVPVTSRMFRPAVNRIGIRQFQQVNLARPDVQPGTRVTQIRPGRRNLQAQDIPVEYQRDTGIGDDDADVMDGLDVHRFPAQLSLPGSACRTRHDIYYRVPRYRSRIG